MCQKPQDEISMHEADCPIELVIEDAQLQLVGLRPWPVADFNVVVVVGPCQLEGPTIRSSFNLSPPPDMQPAESRSYTGQPRRKGEESVGELKWGKLELSAPRGAKHGSK